MRSNYLWYQFFRYGIVKPALRFFYSDITISGAEHIPEGKPVLFVGNHQNSFLDALHLVANTNRFVHFLTRAEAFGNPWLARFYRSLNMLPVYRLRDGFGTIRKNEAIFQECFRRLSEGDAVLVFAEASHDLKRRVRPLSKGFTRIAFGAEQEFDWRLNLQVVPVGISYGKHQKSRTPVRIEFGESISISNYKEVFQNDERDAAHRLKSEVAEALKTVTMHVEDLNHYPLYHMLLDELEPDRNILLNPEIVNRRVMLIENRCNSEWIESAADLLQKAEKVGVRVKDFISPAKAEPRDLLLMPLYLFSLINNALPYQAVRWTTQQYLEDHTFDASAKFLLGLFLLPAFYLLVSVLLIVAGVDWITVTAYFGLSLATGPLFVRGRDLLFPDTAQKLKKVKPEVYRWMKKKVEEFTALREDLF